MDLRPKYSAVVFCVLIISTLCKFSQGQNLCRVISGGASDLVFVPENDTPGATVATIQAEQDVTASIMNQKPEGLFSLNDFSLIANTVLDYETFDTETPYEVTIECTKVGFTPTRLNLKIILTNINDNAPVFGQVEHTLDVKELTEVGTSVRRIAAIDADGDTVFYRLDAPGGEFGLEAVFEPNILVKKLLYYDRIQTLTMKLYAQDTPISSQADVSHTATATIVVNITDVDNRPPWFQPCTETEIGTSKVCVNSGYQGTISLNQQETGPLPLTPGPVLAIDGDKGINEAIAYRFLGENENATFDINPDTGDITMLKPVGKDDPIILTVLAYQQKNMDQFATTTVILRVVVTSQHPPKFVKPSYEGFISEDAGVDSLVLQSQTSNRPLRVQATDEDFANGVNPYIMFEVIDGTDFSITPEGFILMAKAVSPGIVDLQMRVVDTTNGESSTAALKVEVTPGVPTTIATSPAVTTTMTTIDKTTDTYQTTHQTTDQTTQQTTHQTTDQTTQQTTHQTTDQTTQQTTDQTTHQTTDQTTHQTTDQTSDSKLTGSTSSSQPDTHTTLGLTTGNQQLLAGGYRTEDMAALGASLAVVIVLCLVCIGLLAYRVNSHNSDWKKLSEASVFRSSLAGGSSGPKEGVQYTNQGFQNDGDSGSVTSRLAADLEMKLESGLRSDPGRVSSQEPSAPSAASVLQTASNSRAAPDSSSLANADTVDAEKEVKPILTKERRAEEGYKAVWFKQDIDPNTKEEVVIIPDTGEPADHDDDDDDEEHLKTDMDEELADSEDEEGLTSDL